VTNRAPEQQSPLWRRLIAMLRQDGLAREIGGAAAASAVVRLSGVAMGFATGVFLARHLGPEGFGVYGSALAIAALFLVLAQVGLPQLITRDIAAGLARGDASAVKQALIHYPQIVGGLGLFVAGLGMVGYLLWPGEKITGMTPAIAWAFAALPATALIALACGAMRGMNRVVSAQAYDALIRPGLFLVLLAAAYFLAPVSAASALALQFAAAVLTIAIAAGHIWRAAPSEVRIAQAGAMQWGWLRSAAPMTGTEIIRAIEGQYPVLLIGVLASIADAGVFRVALAAIAFVGLPATLITLVVMSHVARLHADGDRETLQKLATGAAAASFAGVLALSLILLVFGQWLIRLVFGAEYQGAWLPLMFLCAAYLTNAFFGSGATILNMAGGEKALTAIYALGPLIGIGLTIALYPWWGLNAVGLAMTVGEIVRGAMIRGAAKRRLGIDISLASAAGLLLRRPSRGAGK
jgi:O-antigen/teichoic acid export membrane protein